MTQLKKLNTLNEWKDVLSDSNEKPVLVFKHSTTCPISASAYDEYKSYETDLDKYIVAVIESRPVSNEIANDLGITHQSPQVLLLQKEQPLWNASHWKITGQALGNAVKEHITE
ncbi:bacillithiol system redox-active protein YtxJ [Bacillus sp. FSL K6-3431]|uniref:bacillithiol system redox-active protein YtxJ n=1 Tax=Bacillus sp. FSL K6-3431 TaxID=2921500 RepID=UPI0030FCA247